MASEIRSKNGVLLGPLFGRPWGVKGAAVALPRRPGWEVRGMGVGGLGYRRLSRVTRAYESFRI